MGYKIVDDWAGLGNSSQLLIFVLFASFPLVDRYKTLRCISLSSPPVSKVEMLPNVTPLERYIPHGRFAKNTAS